MASTTGFTFGLDLGNTQLWYNGYTMDLEQLQFQLRDALAVIDSYADQMAILNNGNVRLGAEFRKQIASLEARVRELEALVKEPEPAA